MDVLFVGVFEVYLLAVISFILNEWHGYAQVWDFSQCVEVDAQYLYSGPAWDLTARKFAALTVNNAINTNLTEKDVSFVHYAFCIATLSLNICGTIEMTESFFANSYPF